MSDFDYSGPSARLLEIGKPMTPWPDYPAVYQLSAGHILDLIRMAEDEHTWEEDSESPAVYRNVHAWRALAQLQAVEAIPALVSLLRWVDDYNDDWTGEDLPEALGLMGPAAIPILSDYLADTEHGLWARTAAATSLEEIGKRHPASRSECATAIARALAAYQQNSPLLNAELIVALASLEQPETYPLVEQAFRSDMVDLSVMGDWEDFQVKVGLLEERITERERYYDFAPFFSTTPDPAPKGLTGKVEKKAKTKRKMAKQSRKKNRKKKK